MRSTLANISLNVNRALQLVSHMPVSQPSPRAALSSRSLRAPPSAPTARSAGAVSHSSTRRASAARCWASPGGAWLSQDKRRPLHAVVRVGDLDAYVEYVKKHFGMKLLRTREVPAENYTNAFVGYGSERDKFALELTYNWGVESYDVGDGFGHFGLALTDVYGAAKSIKEGGGMVTRDAGPVKGGTTVIAFVKDPAGYMWELIQRPKESPEPICQVMLRVGDLNRSIKWYEEVLGMRLLRTRDSPEHKYTLAFMAYGEENNSTVIELTYNYGRKEYNKGNAYAQVAISTTDVDKTAEQVRAAGGAIIKEPTVLDNGTKIMSILDPDGYKYVFVDEADFKRELEASGQ